MLPGSPFADPRFLKALRGLEAAMAFAHQGNVAEADAAFARVVKKNPHYFDALHLYGLFKYQQGKPAEALNLIAKAAKVSPRSAEALNSLGVVYGVLGRHAEALASFDSAIALKPDYAAALGNRGVALNEFGRYLDTVATTDCALAIDPGQADAYISRGAALLRLKRLDEALSCYEQTIKLNPVHATAWLGRGNVLFELKRYREAVASFDQTLRLRPDIANARDVRLLAKLNICEWGGHDAECAGLITAVREQDASVLPLLFLAIPSSPEDQLACARQRVAANFPPSKKPLWQSERYDHGRIRLAYLSADLGDHPVAFLSAGLFEVHDRSRFETIGLSFSPDDGSATRARLEKSFDTFIDVSGQSHGQIAELVRKMEVDIAVDLMGFTQDARESIYARRPAPVQVNYLGYAGTMGAPYIDYIIADRIVIPQDQRRFYAEKIVTLPDCFMPSDDKRVISDKAFTRAEMGLPDEGFVFCSFNRNFKITPQAFDAWARILKAVEGSVLWLSKSDAGAQDNLRCEAEARGVSAARLIFAERLPSLADHLARQRCADLFLDGWPYNAHSTANDALWAGLPVLTLRGATFAGRVAESQLHAIGLPELVAPSEQAYEAKAVALATQRGALDAMKRKLAEYRLRAPLFDTARYARNLEAAYIAMHNRRQQRMPPDHIGLPDA